jgi:[ribosomal protein S5]-alanine N-acetyltransferase
MDIEKLTLKTNRVELKPALVSDAKELFPYLSNPEIPKLMSWDAHTSLEQSILFCKNIEEQRAAGTSINWVIRKENKVCGLFGLIAIKRTHRSLIYDKAELAYWCAPEFQGQGIMKESGKAVIDFCFKNLKLNKLTVSHHCDNQASKGLILALGFQFHYHEKRAFKKHGEWIDCDFYQLFNPNYAD